MPWLLLTLVWASALLASGEEACDALLQQVSVAMPAAEPAALQLQATPAPKANDGVNVIQATHAGAAAVPVVGAAMVPSLQAAGPLEALSMSARVWALDAAASLGATGEGPDAPKPASPTAALTDKRIMKFQVVTLCVWLVFLTLAAYYHREGAFRRALFPFAEHRDVIEGAGFDKWRFGLLECCDTPVVCLCAFMFPAIRWSMTLGYARILPFWLAFLLYMFFSIVSSLERICKLGFWCWILVALLCSAYRQQLRNAFEFPGTGFCSFLKDFLVYACCFPCAITQEARHVEEAMRCSHPAVSEDGDIRQPKK